jgi:SPP1 gp7 family putative phage head morphogenesis protein
LRAYAESPWLHIKIARLAASWANVPFKVVAEDAKGKETDLPRAHPLHLLMRKPNPAMSGWDLRFLTELYIRSVGECYWRVRGSSLGRELWVYPANWVTRVFDRNRQVSEYQVAETQPGGVNIIRVPASQMIWLRSPDPLEPYSAGLGDALSLASEIDTFELASESDRRFFENDASPPGALVVPGRLTQDENDRMRDDFQRKQGGPENQGKPMLLWGGMDWKSFRAGRKEMDFIDGQRYLRDVIIAGVHKHVLGITDDVNFAAAKAADYQVSKWELAPRVPWWEDNTDKIAIMYDERAHVRWDNPVPQDEQIELQKANEGLLRGAITRNEWRVINKMEPLPDDIGHVFIIPPGLVVVPADEAAQMPVVSPQIPPEARPEGGTPENRPPAEDDDKERGNPLSVKHTPGGHEHDQSSHGGEGGGGGDEGDGGKESSTGKLSGNKPIVHDGGNDANVNEWKPDVWSAGDVLLDDNATIFYHKSGTVLVGGPGSQHSEVIYIAGKKPSYEDEGSHVMWTSRRGNEKNTLYFVMTTERNEWDATFAFLEGLAERGVNDSVQAIIGGDIKPVREWLKQGKAAALKAWRKYKAPVFDPLHPSWRRVLEQVSGAVKTDDTMDVLRPIYEAVMESRISDVKEELGINVGLSLTDPDLLAYLRSAAGERITRVDENTRDQIREALEEGIRAGDNLRGLEERLNTVFDIAKEHRAERIARTEVIDASNATAYASYQRSGVVEGVEWLLAPDYDGEEDDFECEAIEEAGPVRVGEEFVPGIAWPPGHPNCRCAIAPVVAGDELAEIVDAEAVVEDRMGARGMVEDQKREAVEKEGLPVLPITSEEKQRIIKQWNEEIVPQFNQSRKDLRAAREIQGGSISQSVADENRAMEKFFGKWAEVTFEDMKRWLPESVQTPLYKGFKITSKKGAFYEEGFIHINRELALSKMSQFNEVVNGLGQVQDNIDLWHMQTIFHEVSHAMFDWSANMVRFYNEGGKSLIEAVNDIMGTQHTRTWLETVGIKVQPEAIESFLYGKDSSYSGYVQNWDRWFQGFNVNIRDERVASRIYASMVVDDANVPQLTRIEGASGGAPLLRQFNMDRVFDSIEPEIRSSMSDEIQAAWDKTIGGGQTRAIREEAKRSWTSASKNWLGEQDVVGNDQIDAWTKQVKDAVQNRFDKLRAEGSI